MRPTALIALLSAALSGPAATLADDPAAQDPRPAPAPKPADGDAPLPQGFPDGTDPGKIEVKEYPAYRSAVAKGERMSMGSGDFLFWALFRHIERNDIAMTSPVINTYDPALIETPGARGEVDMEFLYRTPDMGKLGKDGNMVEVVDHPAATFVCLGVQGGMSDAEMRDGVAKLQAWLDEHKDEWVADGPPRRLGYHGPMTPVNRRLWEVQIPVKPAGK